MKVIDLLNRIANGEEVPKEIHYNCVSLYWCEPCKIYETMRDGELCGKDLYTLLDNLNDEVEIIEDELRDIEVCGSLFTRSEYNRLAGIKEDKKIEKLKYLENGEFVEIPSNEIIMNKINEIIDYLEENK